MDVDRVLSCIECGNRFVWSIEEQTPAPPPDRCPMCRRLAPAPGRMRGLVKWYSRARGYGFITPIEGAELFVHKSGLAQESEALRAGQLVEYRVSTGRRGVQAEDVVVLELPAPAGGVDPATSDKSAS